MYAYGKGTIHFGRKLSEDEFLKLKEILGDVFETIYFLNSDNYFLKIENVTLNHTICVNTGGERYYDEADVEEALKEIRDIAPIEDAEITFIGEDDTYWKHNTYWGFICRNNVWELLDAEINYGEIDCTF